MGVTTFMLGLFLLAYPLVTAAPLTTVHFGWVLILVFIAQFIFALHLQTMESFLLIAMRSVLFGIAGGCLVFFPLTSVETLAALLVAMLLAGAGVEGVLALLLRPEEGRGWVVLDAAASFLMGAMILAGWAASSVWAMGTLAGVAVLVSGISRVMIATKMRGSVVTVVREREYRRAA
jgi:uncharacterized membrane protein HdeD (DUF308 family)